jgi:hypothetical protein
MVGGDWWRTQWYAELDSIRKTYTESDPERRRVIVEAAESALHAGPQSRLALLSFLYAVTRSPGYARNLLEYAVSAELSPVEKDYLYWNLVRIEFTDPNCWDPSGHLELIHMYRRMLASWRGLILCPRQWMPRRDRNSNLVLVVTNQLLGPGHAPTSDTLDYCRILRHDLGKDVFLVNTASMPRRIVLPWFQPFHANFDERLTSATILNYGDLSIPFWQIGSPMPDWIEIQRLVNLAATRKPVLVLSLGGANLATELCSRFTTVVSFPFSTDLPTSESTFVVLPREYRETDAPILEALGSNRDSVIECTYTFCSQPPKRKHSRRDCGVPDNAFVLAVVGNRLDVEISTEFCTAACELLQSIPDLFLMFIGGFARHAEICQAYPLIRQRTVSLGQQDDVPGLYRICNGYLNPRRTGGATSAAQAMEAGLPVFTAPSGHVAATAGPGFHFESTAAVRDAILRLQTDPGFRKEMQQRAIDRFAQVSDRRAMLKGILDRALAGDSR